MSTSRGERLRLAFCLSWSFEDMVGVDEVQVNYEMQVNSEMRRSSKCTGRERERDVVCERKRAQTATTHYDSFSFGLLSLRVFIQKLEKRRKGQTAMHENTTCLQWGGAAQFSTKSGQTPAAASADDPRTAAAAAGREIGLEPGQRRCDPGGMKTGRSAR